MKIGNFFGRFDFNEQSVSAYFAIIFFNCITFWQKFAKRQP